MFRTLVGVVFLSTMAVHSDTAPVEVGNVQISAIDSRRFTARVSFIVPSEMHGWFIHLVFDRPVDVLESEDTDVTKRSDVEFDLSSKLWNRNLPQGYPLNIVLTGNITRNSTVLPSGGCTELRRTLRDPSELHTCTLLATSNPPTVLSDECKDHVEGGGITCEMLPNFCIIDYARVLCRKFCGLCVQEHGCNFEQSACSWLPDSRPLFLNWTRVSGFKGGLLSGPEKDHTFHTAAGSYMLASSEGGFLGQEAVLMSQELPHNITHCLTLWHNVPSGKLSIYRQVQGMRMEMLAEVRASGDQNAALNEPWSKLVINIPTFWHDYSVIIVATPGDNRHPPVTIDDVSLRNGECNAPDVTAVIG